MLAAAPPAHAQEPSTRAAVASLGQAHADASSHHLTLVGAWGAANLVAGSTILLITPPGGVRSFGLQSALWGATNVSIAMIGLASQPDQPASSLAAISAAEDRMQRVLRLNLALNVGYVAVGTAMLVGARSSDPHADLWRGHGAAVAVQGLALIVLDGAAYAASRRRDAAAGRVVSVTPIAGGVRLSVPL